MIEGFPANPAGATPKSLIARGSFTTRPPFAGLAMGPCPCTERAGGPIVA
jgi:hypothetical protein